VTDVSYAVGVAYNISVFGSSDGTTFYPAESCTIATLDDLTGGGADGSEPNGVPDAVDNGCVNPANLPELLGHPGSPRVDRRSEPRQHRRAAGGCPRLARRAPEELVFATA
jgi:hypothetical protein